jgi:hypothetical protein
VGQAIGQNSPRTTGRRDGKKGFEIEGKKEKNVAEDEVVVDVWRSGDGRKMLWIPNEIPLGRRNERKNELCHFLVFGSSGEMRAAVTSTQRWRDADVDVVVVVATIRRKSTS